MKVSVPLLPHTKEAFGHGDSIAVSKTWWELNLVTAPDSRRSFDAVLRPLMLKLESFGALGFIYVLFCYMCSSCICVHIT